MKNLDNNQIMIFIKLEIIGKEKYGGAKTWAFVLGLSPTL